jgi:hypothetical protein
MLMTKRPVASKMSKLGEVLPKLHKTIGGSRETELNELAVTPTRRVCLLPEVTTVTPVPKLPNALRKSRLSKEGDDLVFM